jgi:hypothetical protein
MATEPQPEIYNPRRLPSSEAPPGSRLAWDLAAFALKAGLASRLLSPRLRSNRKPLINWKLLLLGQLIIFFFRRRRR